MLGISFSAINGLVLGCVLFSCSTAANAQRHGGHGMAGGGGIAGISRPTGIDEKDTLKDFHQVLALTGDQRASRGVQPDQKYRNRASGGAIGSAAVAQGKCRSRFWPA